MMLILTPARLSTPRALQNRVESLVHGLRYSGTKEWRLHYNEPPAQAEPYATHARARNEAIERYLKPWHQWVLWVDVDIIEMPENLIEVLTDCSTRHGRAIVAPMVWMERVLEGPPSIPAGGWFYDIGAFVDAQGRHAEFSAGVAGDEDEVEMESVGCVYLAPAELYRQGCHYAARNGEVEHLSFMRQARALGTPVVATRKAVVTHAYLPKWGMKWHHERRSDELQKVAA